MLAAHEGLDMRSAERALLFREQFEEAGGDRPIIALGLKWLRDNLPERIEPALNHGDYRLGNILAEDSHLTGVLDWELAHFGDRHEDLAFGCMTVWRFARVDRPALGLDDVLHRAGRNRVLVAGAGHART